MEVNADFTQRVVVHSDALPWVPSPMPGVERRMLDRIGDEVARATSIVRYAPGSAFSSHVHTGGEEFIVLEGVFQDEHGDFPSGSYIRNPPESSHTPASNPGCVIFVKLWQFDPDDRVHVRAHLDRLELLSDTTRSGVSAASLYQDGRERVRLERWAPNATIDLDTRGGAELLVLAGQFEESEDTLGLHSWMRLPIDGPFQAKTGDAGTCVWIKQGHLHHVAPPVVA